MSPGNELIDKKELDEIKKIFTKSDGIYLHGFDKRRKNIRVRNLRKSCLKFNKMFNVLVLNKNKIALKALGVKHGDEVITQSFNFIATIEAILDCKKPIITGINDGLNMPVNELSKLDKKN